MIIKVACLNLMLVSCYDLTSLFLEKARCSYSKIHVLTLNSIHIIPMGSFN